MPRPHVSPLTSSPLVPGDSNFRTLPRLPALSSTVLPSGSGAVRQPVPSSFVAPPAHAVRARKKYRDRFSLEEEEALLSFWFKNRFKFSVKSKILWRLAERNGVTQRDPISVQKHFDHMLKHGRMRELFRTFRRKGRLGDIIDSIDVERDFCALPSKKCWQDGRAAGEKLSETQYDTRRKMAANFGSTTLQRALTPTTLPATLTLPFHTKCPSPHHTKARPLPSAGSPALGASPGCHENSRDVSAVRREGGAGPPPPPPRPTPSTITESTGETARLLSTSCYSLCSLLSLHVIRGCRIHYSVYNSHESSSC